MSKYLPQASIYRPTLLAAPDISNRPAGSNITFPYCYDIYLLDLEIQTDLCSHTQGVYPKFSSTSDDLSAETSLPNSSSS